MLTLSPDQLQNLANALRADNVALKMSCGGNGSCKTCRVMLNGKAVLACQTDIDPGNHEIIVSAHALQVETFQLDGDLEIRTDRISAYRLQQLKTIVPSADDLPGVSDIDRLRHGLDMKDLAFDLSVIAQLAKVPLEGEATIVLLDGCAIDINPQPDACWYVLGIDIGTTTVSCAIVDARSGEVMAQAGKANAQYNHAEDLAARISFCSSPDRLSEMRTLILRDTLIPLTKELMEKSGASSDRVLTTVVSGNAPMIHLMLGYDPTSMGGYPFNGVDFAPQKREARKFGLPGRQVEFVPAQSAYFGGDVVNGLWHMEIAAEASNTLFLDLGTNAEMALVSDDKLTCTAAPAGPAFEGGGLAWGIGGVDGAIDHVWEKGDQLSFSTINDAPARGICGSGIIAFVAAAFRAGRLTKAGRFRDGPEIGDVSFGDRTMRAWYLTSEIYITEDDISKFLQAKAAVFSAIHSLCRQQGITPGDLSQIHIAGNFGRYFKTTDAMAIGLLPESDPEKINICGNTSLAGACRTALDGDALKAQGKIVADLQFLDLNGLETFQDDFIDALFLPHRSKDLFPGANAERKSNRRARIRARVKVA